jgi:tight adherence protein C
MDLQMRSRRWIAWWQTRKRNVEMGRALPEALDLLILVMQAGLDFQVALAHYLDHSPHNALWDEFMTVQTEIRTGLSRIDALRHLAARATEPSLQETARTLVQALELGSSLTPILRQQAKALRQRRSYDAERRAALAPLKLMFPLMVFIFPSLFVILFTPIVLQIGKESLLP